MGDEAVEHDDLVPVGDESVHDGGPDEAGATGDEDALLRPGK
jgi:hypothetical protein